MKAWAAIVYLAFFALIFGAIWITESAMPLWAMIFVPFMDE